MAKNTQETAPKQEPKGYEPVKAGHDPRKDSLGGNWLKLESNVPVDVVCLVNKDEILMVEQCAIWLDEGNSPVWVYTGPNDPSHDLHIDKRYRAYLPVLVEGEAKIWSMGRGAHMALLDISDSSGDLKGQVLRLKRTGMGLQTKYSVLPRGKKKDVSTIEEVDVLGVLGPLTRAGVVQLLESKMGMSYEDIVASYNQKAVGKNGGGGATAPKKSKPIVIEDDVDDEDDDDDDEIDDLDLT
jgi:hypothetical protein